MSEKQVLFELDFDIDALMSNTQKTYKVMDDLMTKQKELKDTMSGVKKEIALYGDALKEAKKSGDQAGVDALTKKVSELEGQYKDTSKAIITNNGELASARREYGVGVKAVEAYTQKQTENMHIIAKSGASIDELSAAISSNVVAYKKLNAEQRDTEAGKKLNQLIADQREEYKKLQNEIGNTSVNVGDYEGAINNALKSNVDLAAGMDQMGGGIAGTIKGFVGMTKAALAFIATPIGMVFTLIAGVVMTLVKAFGRSEESMAKLKQITGALSGVFGGFMNVLKPVVSFIADTAVKAFEGLGNMAEKTMGLVSKGLKLLGLDKAAAGVDKFTASVKENAKAGQELAKMEADQVVRERELKRIQFEYLKEQEKFRQVRDDVSKSIADRIKANDNLGASLLNQSKIEMETLKQALSIAEKRLQVDGETSENLDKVAEAKANIADLEERINGFQSEQLVNAVGLRKEAADAAKAQQDAAKAKAKELSDEAKAKAEEAIATAQTEIDIWIETNKSKLKSDKDYSNQSVQAEQDRLTAIYEKQSKILDEQRKNGLIKEGEYNLQKLQLQNGYIEQVQALDDNYQAVLDAKQQSQIDKEQTDFDQKLQLKQLQGESEFSLQAQQLDRERQQAVEAARVKGEDTTTIEAIYAEKKKQIDQSVLDAQLSGTEQVLGSIAGLLGENTVAGKAAAIAQTTISTYQAAQQAYAAMVGIPVVGPALGAIAAGVAVAGGLQNIRKIASTNTDVKAEDGLAFNIGGNRHSAGGTKFYGSDGTRFEAEKGETMFVLNRLASSRLAPMLSNLNMSSGGRSLMSSSNYLASGGSVGRMTSISTTTNIADPINYDLLASKIGEANRQLPAPVVGVKQILKETDTYAKVVDGANL